MDDDLNKPNPRRVQPPQRLPGSQAPSSPSEARSPWQQWAGLLQGMDVTFEGKKQQFGPDGEPLEHTFGTGAAGALEHTFGTHKQKKPELQMQGWFRAESGRMDLEPLARRSLQAICDTVEDMKQRGRCLTGKFTNDPEILPDVRFFGVLPFAPEKSQLLVPDAREIIQEEPIFGEEDEDEYEPVEAQPDKTDRWKRLSEFEPLASGTAMLFDESRVNATAHFGRVYPGHLDNMYLVEALNAISLRPALARSLFLCYDTKRAVYILRIFKNGIWLKVEVDDYAPLAPNGFEPLCCRSEHFPYILWPSLVEKAYAKVHTLRDGQNPDDNSGGWMAIGGGGQVEDALADLTGGVSGRFYTQDVSPDRLFLYLYNLQRDTLFLCHVNESKCARKGIPLNPCAAHVINRAATHDGRCYVQVFSADPKGPRDGGLSELTVPSELLRDYPEKSYEGFFWLAIEDFHAYFSTIIECRLTSSPDVGIVGMPPPRLAGEPTGREPLYFETVFANPGQIAGINSPEISVQTPSAPCEIIISAQQTDSRITQVGDHRKPYVPLLIKVYENLGAGNVYSAHVVCRSNWIPTRDAMVAFQTAGGGSFKVVLEMPEGAMCDRLILRCYSSLPYTEFFVNPSMAKHLLALPQGPPIASRFTLVGTVDPGRIARTDIPEPMSDNLDDVRRRHASSSGAGCVAM